MSPRRPSPIEPLESRIAPAIALQNPLPDLIAGPGKTGATIDLSEMFNTSATSPNRTIVEFLTNFDTDIATPGLQAGVIRIELLDDLVPLTVQNFLSYVNNRNTAGDYDNTFFHRAEPGFVLQGGGFNVEGARAHIPTGLEVHNEFSPTRSNVRGTITMAKTGLGPHTATSEFFFNLKDNNTGLPDQGNLDLQNGGFTVFGNVISGMEVADAIAVLPRQRVIGSFLAPVQNYVDPDNNTATTNPVPTADQLIRIVDARVVPPDVGSTGITYTIQNIFQAGTTTPSNIVTGTVRGSTLNLAYKAGAAGVVDVVVRAVGPDGPTDVVTDTFRVSVLPNLITSIASDPLPLVLTANDAGTVNVRLSNSGGGAAVGRVDIQLKLAEVNASTGVLVNGGAEIPLGLVDDRSINLAGGASITIAAPVRMPAGLLTDVSKTYRVVADVVPSGTLATQELFTDDNRALNGGTHAASNQFGTFNSRTNVPLTYVEGDGDRVTFTLSGGGIGRATPDGTGKVDITLVNTTVNSRLTAQVVRGASGDGRIDINDINLTGVLNAATLGLVDVDGSVAVGGGIRMLQLGDLTGPGAISIGALLPANTDRATIRLGRVSDYTFESLQPVASLTATEWLDTGGLTESLSFYSLGTLSITGARGTSRGDLQASVNVSSSAAVGTISVAGILQDATVTTVGNIGTVALGAMVRSAVFAGTDGRPAALADFDAERTISAFSIRGISGFTGDLFVASQVAADTIGSVSVQKVAQGNSGTPFGFVADVIRTYNRVGGARLTNLDPPATLDLATDYRVTIL